MHIENVFAYLCVDNASNAIDFYHQAFGAEETFRLSEPSGRIGHAELNFGPMTIMLSDPSPEVGVHPPSDSHGASVGIHLHVDDADAMINQAATAGATVEQAPQDQFFGERIGTIRDPFGHRWLIGHRIEQVSPEEMQRRYEQLLQDQQHLDED